MEDQEISRFVRHYPAIVGSAHPETKGEDEMKPYKKAALRRRFYRNLPKIKRIIWLISSVLLIAGLFVVFTRKTKASQTVKEIIPTRTHIVYISQIPEKTRTDEEIIRSLPNGDLVWKTYGHESTWGKFDGCRSQGKYNGFGFEQDEHGYRCFDSLEQVATSVSAWFDHYVQLMTVRQTLCFYRYGKLMDNCDYADYTLNL